MFVEARGATEPLLAAEAVAATPAAIEPVGLRLNTTAVAPAPAHASQRDQGPRMRSTSSLTPRNLFANGRGSGQRPPVGRHSGNNYSA